MKPILFKSVRMLFSILLLISLLFASCQSLFAFIFLKNSQFLYWYRYLQAAILIVLGLYILYSTFLSSKIIKTKKLNSSSERDTKIPSSATSKCLLIVSLFSGIYLIVLQMLYLSTVTTVARADTVAYYMSMLCVIGMYVANIGGVVWLANKSIGSIPIIKKISFLTSLGRINRMKHFLLFLFYSLSLSTIVMLFAFLLKAEDIQISNLSFTIPFAVTAFAIFINIFLLKIRRLHDFNFSAWWMLLLVIPVIGLIWAILIFCIRGTDGVNRFDEQPVSN